jgi:hypothetical protein
MLSFYKNRVSSPPGYLSRIVAGEERRNKRAPRGRLTSWGVYYFISLWILKAQFKLPPADSLSMVQPIGTEREIAGVIVFLANLCFITVPYFFLRRSLTSASPAIIWVSHVTMVFYSACAREVASPQERMRMFSYALWQMGERFGGSGLLLFNLPLGRIPMRKFSTTIFYRWLKSQLRFLPEGVRYIGNGKLVGVVIQGTRRGSTGWIWILDIFSEEIEIVGVRGRPGFIFATTRPDTYVVGVDNRVRSARIKGGRLDWTNHLDVVLPLVEGETINDAIAYGDMLIVGTKDMLFLAGKRQDQQGSLFLIRDKTESKLLAGQGCSNCKWVVKVGSQLVLWDINTPDQQVKRWNLTDRRLESPATIVDFRGTKLYPDGGKPCPGGKSAVIALFAPAPTKPKRGLAVQVSLDPQGSTKWEDLLEAEWEITNASQVTNVEFIPGVNPTDNLRLVMSTAAENMTKRQMDEYFHSGFLFVGETDFPADLLPQPVLFTL